MPLVKIRDFLKVDRRRERDELHSKPRVPFPRFQNGSNRTLLVS